GGCGAQPGATTTASKAPASGWRLRGASHGRCTETSRPTRTTTGAASRWYCPPSDSTGRAAGPFRSCSGTEPKMSRIRIRAHLVALAALCAAVALAAVWEAAGDSTTIDEPVYVSAGMTALTRQDLRLNPQHPPLAKV